MSIDGFVGCLALLVALYTIAPPIAKLRLKLLGWRIWLPSILLITAIFYLLLFKYIGLYCYADYCASLTLDADSRAPNDLAFLIVVLWLGILAVGYRARNFSIRNYSTFRNLVEQLLSDRRYGELVELIEPHIDNLAKRATRSHWLQRALDKIRVHGTEKAAWIELLTRKEKKDENPSHLTSLAEKGNLLVYIVSNLSLSFSHPRTAPNDTRVSLFDAF